MSIPVEILELAKILFVSSSCVYFVASSAMHYRHFDLPYCLRHLPQLFRAHRLTRCFPFVWMLDVAEEISMMLTAEVLVTVKCSLRDLLCFLWQWKKNINFYTSGSNNCVQFFKCFDMTLCNSHIIFRLCHFQYILSPWTFIFNRFACKQF